MTLPGQPKLTAWDGVACRPACTGWIGGQDHEEGCAVGAVEALVEATKALQVKMDQVYGNGNVCLLCFGLTDPNEEAERAHCVDPCEMVAVRSALKAFEDRL